MATSKILVHSSASDKDAHIPDAVTKAVALAQRSGVKAEAVESLLEIKRRLMLPSDDPQWAAGAISADRTANVLASTRIDPIMIINPATGQVERLRSPLAAVLPTAKRGYTFVLTDAGAYMNTDWGQVALGALLCGSLWRVLHGKKFPRYGVLGYGEEFDKLPEDLKRVYVFLASFPNRTVKVVESKEVLGGDSVEVLIPRNGEIGNVFLKTAEATLGCFGTILKEELGADVQSKLGAVLSAPAFRRVKARLYLPESHGALVLGCRAPVMKHHGRMDSDGLLLAILRLHRIIQDNVLSRVRADFWNEIERSHPELIPR